MSSRIRENVQHFFECYCEVSKFPKGSSAICKKYPYDYDDNILKTLPDFTYPCEFELSVVQHFSFVLTNIDSKWMYGFCRHDPRTSFALVILSYLPWHDKFYKLLDQIATIKRDINKESSEKLIIFSDDSDNDNDQNRIDRDVEKLLIPQYSNPAPPHLEYKLPKIPENVNLTEYYNAIDTNGMMEILSALLFERRIIVLSRKPSRLAACVQAANDLLYPLVWQHIFIPVLPSGLSDYLLAPMPFLIGVPEPVFESINKNDIGDVVILDADKHIVTSPFNDIDSMPPEAIANLRRALKGPNLLEDVVARAFLSTITYLIVGYRDSFRLQKDQYVFDREAFVSNRGSSMKPFLEKLVTAQTFQQFIEERIALLQNGTRRSDEFERECYAFDTHVKSKTGSRTLSNKLTETLHLPSKILRQVRDKAHPAVESAGEYVKSSRRGMRSAYKDFRSRFENISIHPDNLPRSTRSSSVSRVGKPVSEFEKMEDLGSPSNSEKMTQSCNLGSKPVFSKSDNISNLSKDFHCEPLHSVSYSNNHLNDRNAAIGLPPSPLSPLFPENIFDRSYLNVDSVNIVPTKTERKGVKSAYKDIRNRLENMTSHTNNFSKNKSVTLSRDVPKTLGDFNFPSTSNKTESNSSSNFYVKQEHVSDFSSDYRPDFTTSHPPIGRDYTKSTFGTSSSPPSSLFPEEMSNKDAVDDLIKLNDEPSPVIQRSSVSAADRDLLQEYGLDINRFRLTRSNWTTFD